MSACLNSMMISNCEATFLLCVGNGNIFVCLVAVFKCEELLKYHGMSRKFQKYVSEHLGYVELSWNGGVEPHPFIMDIPFLMNAESAEHQVSGVSMPTMPNA